MNYRPDCLTGINSERRPWRGGPNARDLKGRESRTWATCPTCWLRGKYLVNQARFVGLSPLMKQATGDAHTSKSGVSSSFRSVLEPVKTVRHTTVCAWRPRTERSHERLEKKEELLGSRISLCGASLECQKPPAFSTWKRKLRGSYITFFALVGSAGLATG